MTWGATRWLAAISVVTASALSGPSASATDLPPAPPPSMSNSQLMFAAVPLYRPDRFEIRGGVFAHAIASPESGSVDINLEVVAPKYFTIPSLPDFVTPRFHAGAMLNTAGKTSYVYAGALWTLNITDRWFAEGFFGGLVHNGRLDDTAVDMNGLGCRWAFHSGGSVGYRLNERWSVIGTFDHLSNGTLCTLNKGLNNYGLRAGYTF